tara:strand:- start:691 stop:2457 length:1767 start_codon:yes stop_codon:yes gene_type:complete
VCIFFTAFFADTTFATHEKEYRKPIEANHKLLPPFTFHSWDVDIQVNKNNTILVKETWRGEFLKNKHGLYRHIPFIYDMDHRLSGIVGKGRFLSDIDILSVKKEGKHERYTTKKENGSKVIIIGDPDAYVFGPFEYELVYRVSHPFLFHKTEDELYWNITGTDWESAIPQVTATIHVPNVKKEAFAVDCYTGKYGSGAKDCSHNTQNGKVIISAQDFLTVSVSFPKGVIAEPNFVQRMGKFVFDNWYYYVFLILCVGYTLHTILAWHRNGRDEKGKGVVIPRYTPPKGLSPIACGALLDGKIHSRDFAAMIVLLAVKGYMQIREEKETVFGVISKKYYSFQLVKKLPKNAPGEEKKVFDAIFNSATSRLAITVTLDSRKTCITSSFRKIRDIVFTKLVVGGYFATHPIKTKNRFFGVGFLAIILSVYLPQFLNSQFGVFHGAYFIFGCMFVAGSVGIGFSHFMTKRTRKGMLVKEHVEGFKLFLETADKHRLAWQEKEHIFEKYLPYAMAFGVVEKWASVFKDLNKEESLWYTSADQLSLAAMVSSMPDFLSTIDKISISRSSGFSGSGRGGGGFSGGGRGGGGGGTW